jgi:hypothetical protein
MVVVTLIVTIVFAAAITIELGGNDQVIGTHILYIIWETSNSLSSDPLNYFCSNLMFFVNDQVWFVAIWFVFLLFFKMLAFNIIETLLSYIWSFTVVNPFLSSFMWGMWKADGSR